RLPQKPGLRHLWLEMLWGDRPMCSLQTGLWALIVFTVLVRGLDVSPGVGGFLYLQHQRLAEESAPNGQVLCTHHFAASRAGDNFGQSAALSAAAAAVINVASEAKEESPAPEEGGKSSARELSFGEFRVNDLRAEISALKDLVGPFDVGHVEKHEKMLRPRDDVAMRDGLGYVMDRYVEKDVAAAPKEGAQGTKQATVANLSLTEGGVGGNVATPEVKGEARAGRTDRCREGQRSSSDAPRKRKTGAAWKQMATGNDVAPDSSMVGMPQPEAVGPLDVFLVTEDHQVVDLPPVRHQAKLSCDIGRWLFFRVRTPAVPQRIAKGAMGGGGDFGKGSFPD
ncbi:unnamed protein product, partial [Cladocopium goreaui]